jgi:DNA-binding Xre family transcriptional regulator
LTRKAPPRLDAGGAGDTVLNWGAKEWDIDNSWSIKRVVVRLPVRALLDNYMTKFITESYKLSSLNLPLTKTNMYARLSNMTKRKQTKIRFNLRGVLAEKGITHRKAAEMTGISKTGISVLAGDPSQVQISTIEKLVQGLNVTIDQLFVVEEVS